MNLFYARTEIADLQDVAHKTHAQVADLHDLINPAPSDEEYVDMEDSVEIADSDVQNDELQNRVAQLKEDIALAQSRITTPSSVTPLHPDVYNLPNDTIPSETSHTVEYVK